MLFLPIVDRANSMCAVVRLASHQSQTTGIILPLARACSSSASYNHQLTYLVNWWLERQGIVGLRVRGQRVLQIGLLEDLEPRGRLGTALLEHLPAPSRSDDRLVAVPAVASVLGRSFSLEQLASMLDLTPSRLLDSVGVLVRADILVESGQALAFRHDRR
jgi:hypothetical protein